METKRLLLGLALAGVLIGQTKATEFHLPENMSDPKTMVVKWDVDDTTVKKVPFGPLVRKNADAIAYCLLRHPATFFQKMRGKACSEDWQETFKSFNNNPNSYEQRFAYMIQQISQEKQLLPGMQELMQELADLGYEQHAATNMGENDFKYLQQTKPAMFNLFSHATYVTYDKNKKRIKKPMPEYFTNIVATDNNPNNKQSVIIDDKLENCLSAKNTVGWHYIKVPGNDTNAAFLRNLLRQRGVNVKAAGN